MSIILKEVIKQINQNEIKLVAGEKGLNRSVEWVHMVENLEISDFLVGGEVTFTTGIGINDEMSLFDLVKRVYKNNASGMVINVGPYIPKIPKEVIDFGNEYDFPIFEVPWEVHMANIMKLFSFTIARTEQLSVEISTSFRNAIHAPMEEELYVTELMQKGYMENSKYLVSIIDAYDRLLHDNNDVLISSVLNDRVQFFYKKAENIILSKKRDAVTFIDGDNIVVVFNDINEIEAKKIMNNVKVSLEQWLKKSEVMNITVGSIVNSVKKVYKSFSMAERMAELLRKEDSKGDIKIYSEMGINQLFLQIDDNEVFEQFYNITIKPLEDYDIMNDNNLVSVLSCYMKNNGSVQSTAEELFVHRNTINYKLKKIESLLDVDLTDFSVRSKLYLGLLVWKYYLVNK